MKKQITVFLVALILVTGCQPSEQAIQTAMAQTQAAIPTTTAFPTKTVVPTATAVPTKIVIPTPDYQLCANILGNFAWENADVRITDYKFDLYDKSLNKDALVIRAKAWYSSISATKVLAAVLIGLKAMILGCSSSIPESIVNIQIYTYNSLSDETGLLSGKWSDIVAFSNDEITYDEWFLKVEWATK